MLVVSSGTGEKWWFTAICGSRPSKCRRRRLFSENVQVESQRKTARQVLKPRN